MNNWGWTTEWENQLDLGQNKNKDYQVHIFFSYQGPVPGPDSSGWRWTTEWENQLVLGLNKNKYCFMYSIELVETQSINLIKRLIILTVSILEW